MMGQSYWTNPLEFLIDTLFSLYILIVMLRFFLATVRADFYNPVSQFLVRATNPVLVPLRRVIPAAGPVDLSSVVLMLLLQMVSLGLIAILRGAGVGLGALFIWSIAELASLSITVFIFSIFAQVILSWVNPGTYNPVSSLLYSLNEPLLRPIRRVIPVLGGIDFAPLAALIILQVMKMLLVPPLLHLAG